MSSEKSEKPTVKKRKDAGKRGQSFKSRDVVVAILLLCGACVIVAYGSAVEVVRLLTTAMQDGFRQDPAEYTSALLGLLARSLLPILLACIVALAAPSLYQSKFVLATEALGLKFSSLNPVAGFKKLFSMRTAKDLVKTVLYLVCFCLAAALFWRMQKSAILGQLHVEAADLLPLWGDLLLALVLTCLGCAAAILALDVLAEIFLLTKDLKMEKQEVKREHKEQEGNQEIKAKRREMHMEVLSSQLQSDVEGSSFIVANPTHIAIGIYYKPELVPFPFVSVVETDRNALQVRAYAEKVGVPVIHDIPLARRLFKKHRRYSFIDASEVEAVMRILVWLMQVENAAAPAALDAAALEAIRQQEDAARQAAEAAPEQTDAAGAAPPEARQT